MAASGRRRAPDRCTDRRTDGADCLRASARAYENRPTRCRRRRVPAGGLRGAS